MLIGLPHVWNTFLALSVAYTATDPGWNCAAAHVSLSSRDSGAIDLIPIYGGANVTAVGEFTDPEAKCVYYERGECVPQYSKEYTSIVTEWDLICSTSYYPNLAQSGFFLGMAIGAWLFGTLSDLYGRRKPYFIALAGTLFSGFGSALTPSFHVYLLLRIFVGVFVGGHSVIGYALLLEVTGKSKRALAGLVNHFFFTCGYSLLPLLGYYVREWRAYVMIYTLCGAWSLATWRLTPESPRWLLTQGREKQAVATLAWIARGNGRQMPDCQLQRSAAGPSVSLLDLLRGRTIRHRTIILAIAWFANCAVYYALSLNAGSLGGGRYWPMVLSGLVELPAYIGVYKLASRLGRQLSHGIFLVLAGVCCLAWSLADYGNQSDGLKSGLALLGKAAVAASFTLVYLYSAELFPTEVRTLGLGITSMCSRGGGIMAPLIFLMPSSHAMIVLSGLGVVAGLLTLSLPETLNQPLPETLAQLNSVKLL